MMLSPISSGRKKPNVWAKRSIFTIGSDRGLRYTIVSPRIAFVPITCWQRIVFPATKTTEPFGIPPPNVSSKAGTPVGTRGRFNSAFPFADQVSRQDQVRIGIARQTQRHFFSDHAGEQYEHRRVQPAKRSADIFLGFRRQLRPDRIEDEASVPELGAVKPGVRWSYLSERPLEDIIDSPPAEGLGQRRMQLEKL